MSKATDKSVMRVMAVLLSGFALGAFLIFGNTAREPVIENGGGNGTGELAIVVLEQLEVKGRAPKTGYTREEFYKSWGKIGSCDARNVILKRDMWEVELDGCNVLSGKLNDPYTGKLIEFVRGPGTSSAVQIDHVVAISDAWQKGAQNLSKDDRYKLSQDPLNLLAVDGPVNQAKGDSDAASWLPPNTTFRCEYVARQIAVKQKYVLWVTSAEKDAMKKVLAKCPEERLLTE